VYNSHGAKPSGKSLLRTTDHQIVTIDHVYAGIDILLEASAPGAFHNSGERFNPPRCHPKTRIHIIAKIMNWIVGEVEWDRFVMWLYGPAGAGKSAIAQTIAEHCHASHLLLASFFFSRTDPKRNNEKSLIASIAYQITLNVPEARGAIELQSIMTLQYSIVRLKRSSQCLSLSLSLSSLELVLPHQLQYQILS
jgi:hypothetical protein